MSKRLAARINRVQLSPTVAITARAIALKSAGRDVITLSAGEPDFPTPAHIGEAAWSAIQAGKTKYTAVDGLESLKSAVTKKFIRDNDIHFKSSEILISNGGKQSLFNACQALVETDDEVIIPAPYWASFPDIVRLANAKPLIIQTNENNDFKLTPEQLRSAITSKTRGIIINSPCNPTGAVYTKSDWIGLSKILLKYPMVYIICDEIYEHIYWGKNQYTNLLSCCPELRDRIIIINGVSKCYSMTGWRIGYSAGPENIIKAMTIIQSQSTTNACTISQAAAQVALNGPQTDVVEMCSAFKKRHDYVIQRLNDIDGCYCQPCEGTFYAFPNINEILGKKKLKNDIEFCEKLLEEKAVALVPGSAFGTPGYFRLSFATDIETLETALNRIEEFIT